MSEPNKVEEEKLALEKSKLKLEEYKLWVEDLSRMSDRRGRATTIYVTINSFVFTAIGLFLRGTGIDVDQDQKLIPLLPFLTVGIVTCLAWSQAVNSYSRLAALRVHILREIENLPEMDRFIKMFHAEDALYTGDEQAESEPRKQLNFGNLERLLPWVLCAIYVLFMITIFLVMLTHS